MTLGIRPENLIICPAGTPNSIIANVRVNEMMGSEIHIHADFGGDPTKKIIARVQIADMTDDEQLELLSSKTLSFSLRERTINLFDPDDGRNLAVKDAAPVPKKEA